MVLLRRSRGERLLGRAGGGRAFRQRAGQGAARENVKASGASDSSVPRVPPSPPHDTPAPSPHEEVTALVHRVQSGDRKAFGILVERYRARIFALALHLTGSESEADDITQEGFLRAYRAIDSFAGRSEFFTWLYRIVINLAHSSNRARARRPRTDLEDPRVELAIVVDGNGDPAQTAELRQSYTRLVRALDHLSPVLGSTVVLVALQGMSYGEAAVVLGCSEGTIGWRIHEARRLLRLALAEPPPPRPRTDPARRRTAH